MADAIPAWMRALNDEDWQFVRRFVLASGSLKELAGVYQVSYPTLRARLDRLIDKVQVAEKFESQDPFEKKLRMMVADGVLPAQAAKELLASYRKAMKDKPSRGR